MIWWLCEVFRTNHWFDNLFSCCCLSSLLNCSILHFRNVQFSFIQPFTFYSHFNFVPLRRWNLSFLCTFSRYFCWFNSFMLAIFMSQYFYFGLIAGLSGKLNMHFVGKGITLCSCCLLKIFRQFFRFWFWGAFQFHYFFICIFWHLCYF